VPCEGSAELADGISSASGLTGAKIDGNSSVVSSVVGPWDTVADGSSSIKNTSIAMLPQGPSS
jgi:hypothetical protein